MQPPQPGFWQKHVFTLVIAGCSLFVALTLIAMLVYPGGPAVDPYARGYSFFKNFFSELGFTRTRAGAPNPIAAPLFFIALTIAGICEGLFFLAFTQFFKQGKASRYLSYAGTAFGLASGICFVGVAFTPANLFQEPHTQFVMWAFQLFPVAVFLYTILIFRHPTYPRRYGVVFLVFGVLLVLYVLLLRLGPDFSTPQGYEIQVAGQKIIAYAALISVGIQAWGARMRSKI